MRSLSESEEELSFSLFPRLVGVLLLPLLGGDLDLLLADFFPDFWVSITEDALFSSLGDNIVLVRVGNVYRETITFVYVHISASLLKLACVSSTDSEVSKPVKVSSVVARSSSRVILGRLHRGLGPLPGWLVRPVIVGWPVSAGDLPDPRGHHHS